ncbi:MAG: glycosyltransferase family 2 protein [Elainellaceae cyanobacterium]
MNSNSSLSWALLICTYKREKILPLCIKFALLQTPQPIEIIIVDASPYWEKTREAILNEFMDASPDIRWEYSGAEKRGITVQRNQALRSATADVVFLIDDDSLMYPGCAETILKIYEADSEKRIKGVQPSAASSPPLDVEIDDEAKVVGASDDTPKSKFKLLQTIQGLMWRHIFLMSADQLFIPYYGSFPSHPVPHFDEQQPSIFPVKLFQGFRMTYRRETIEKVEFEPCLLYYASGEDLDASYRVSLHGALVEAPDAQIHHFQSQSGRLKRFQASVFSILNQAVCLKKNSKNPTKNKIKFYTLAVRRLFAEFCKDLLSKRFSFPQLRGTLTGLIYSFRVFSISRDQLEVWYPEFQGQLIEAQKKS